MGGTAVQQEHLVGGCRAYWQLEVAPEEGQEEHRTFLRELWSCGTAVVDEIES